MSGESDEQILEKFLSHRPSHAEYLQTVEVLASKVRDAAFAERGPSIWRREEASTPLEQAIVELSLALRVVHTDDDGCIEERRDSN